MIENVPFSESSTKFEKFFPINFTFNNQQFEMAIRPFGTRVDEKWLQIGISLVEKKRFRSSKKTEVGTITLKFPKKESEDQKTLSVMGNYNLTVGKSNPIKGIINFSIQEIVEKTGYSLEVSGLTLEGIKLWQRLSEKHRDAVGVMSNEQGTEYKIFSVSN